MKALQKKYDLVSKPIFDEVLWLILLKGWINNIRT